MPFHTPTQYTNYLNKMASVKLQQDEWMQPVIRIDQVNQSIHKNAHDGRHGQHDILNISEEAEAGGRQQKHSDALKARTRSQVHKTPMPRSTSSRMMPTSSTGRHSMYLADFQRGWQLLKRSGRSPISRSYAKDRTAQHKTSGRSHPSATDAISSPSIQAPQGFRRVSKLLHARNRSCQAVQRRPCCPEEDGPLTPDRPPSAPRCLTCFPAIHGCNPPGWPGRRTRRTITKAVKKPGWQ